MSGWIRDNITTVSIDTLVPNTWNFNEQPEVMFEHQKAAIVTHGLMKPITVREVGKRFEILNGYHRWLACKELQVKKVPINNLGEVSDGEARLYTALLNEITGQADVVRKSQIIERLYESDHWEQIQNSLPMDGQEMENYLAIARESVDTAAAGSHKVIQSYSITCTVDQAKVVDQALATFPEDMADGEKFLSMAVRYGEENGYRHDESTA